MSIKLTPQTFLLLGLLAIGLYFNPLLTLILGGVWITVTVIGVKMRLKQIRDDH